MSLRIFFQFYREIAVHILKETQNIFNKHESPSYIYILNYLIFIQEKPKLIDLSDPSVVQGKIFRFSAMFHGPITKVNLAKTSERWKTWNRSGGSRIGWTGRFIWHDTRSNIKLSVQKCSISNSFNNRTNFRNYKFWYTTAKYRYVSI